MIYILKSQEKSILKFYGIDKVIDDLGSYTLQELLEQDKTSRIGIVTTEGLQELLDMNYPFVIVHSDRDEIHPAYKPKILPMGFFRRDAKEAAKELLGKLIVRNGIAGKIVETEAYYGDRDPASRAYKGKKNYNRGMWLPGGHIFIYMVHANWMFNITTDDEEAQAVLIRAVEPIAGLHYMYRQRNKKLRELCNGPGKWTRAFGISRDMNEKPLGKEIFIAESPWDNFEIARAHRIGVREDLEEPLRFFIKDSRFVSVRKIS